MKCFIKKCFNFYPSQDGSISFFKFPVKSDKRDLWLKALPPCNRPDSESSRICSEHFAKSDIVVHNRRKRLAPNAVPSINIKDEEESTCSGFGDEGIETPFKKTTQIPNNILLPNGNNVRDSKCKKHKSNLKERKSLKWALETTGEDGVNREYILRNKLEILRRFVKTKNLEAHALES